MQNIIKKIIKPYPISKTTIIRKCQKWYMVKKKKISNMKENENENSSSKYHFWSTHRNNSFKGALTVHFITDVVVGPHQCHTWVLHPVYVIFIRHHKHQTNPETQAEKKRNCQNNPGNLICMVCVCVCVLWASLVFKLHLKMPHAVRHQTLPDLYKKTC